MYALLNFDQTSTLYALIRACTLIYFWDLEFFVKYSGLMWNFFNKNLVYYLVTFVYFWLIGDKPA